MLAIMKSNTVVHAAALFVEHADVAPDQVVDGHPRTGIGQLGRFGELELGVWEMTPGVLRDVEAEEVFVVLSGAAIVEFNDDTTPLSLAAGDVVRLAEGTRTVWTVTETLRKVYLT
jgi:uncharacterized cupin superfamily protein